MALFKKPLEECSTLDDVDALALYLRQTYPEISIAESFQIAIGIAKLAYKYEN